MRVLHVVATADRRGAELFAGDLAARLEREVEQLVVVLRRCSGTLAYPVEHVCLSDGRARRFDPELVVRLTSVVRRWRPDVVTAHGGEALKHAALATGRPIVYRRIGSVTARGIAGPRRVAHAALMRRARRVVVLSAAGAEETTTVFGVPGRKVRLIPNAVDASRLRPCRGRDEVRASLSIDPAAFVVLSLGALTWEKDPLAHLEVSRRAGARRSDLIHVFAGDGPLRPELEAAAAPRGAGVKVLGTRDDVADLLGASDAVLLASRTEGVPACLIEAGLAGVPSVAYAFPGVTEVVAHGEGGWLAPPGDLPALAGGLVRLVANRRAAAGMGAVARARCRERFDLGRAARAYLEIYEEVAGGR